jgi:uncharacterized protein (TIGR02996 family)
MADVMAIVSKAIFEKAAGKSPRLGTKLAMDRYVSTNKTFDALKAGGKLYLVTVRPPNEALWLVAVLDNPKFDGKQWLAKPCDTPLTDITSVRTKLKFESGKGITAAPGALGMSLQTPRALAAADSALIDGLLAPAAPAPAPAAPAGPAIPEPPSVATSGNRDRRSLLLHAVLTEPEDELARRVYADDLLQSNDRRGEYILLELALAGPLSIRKRDELKRRHGELKKANAATWWPYKFPYRTRGGFIHAISGSFGQISTAADTLFASEPVVEVTVTGIGDDKAAAKLAKSAWLGGLRGLVVRGQIGDDGFATLCTTPALAKLRSLNVTANELGSDALGALGSNFPQLKTLVLTANPIGDDGIAGLVAWKHLGQLETLYLSQCELSADGVAALLAGTLTSLRKITLSSNALGDGLAAAFAKRAAALHALRHIELVSCEIDASDATALAKKLPGVTRIDVRRNEIEDEDVSGSRIRAS